MFRTAETFRAEVEALTRQTITDHQVEQVLAGIWPDNPDATDRTRASAARRRDAVRSMYRSDPRVTGWHGTWPSTPRTVSAGMVRSGLTTAAEVGPRSPRPLDQRHRYSGIEERHRCRGHPVEHIVELASACLDRGPEGVTVLLDYGRWLGRVGER